MEERVSNCHIPHQKWARQVEKPSCSAFKGSVEWSNKHLLAQTVWSVQAWFEVKQSELGGVYYFIQHCLWKHYRMASLLDVLIFDAVYGSWILSLPLFTLDDTYRLFFHCQPLLVRGRPTTPPLRTLPPPIWYTCYTAEHIKVAKINRFL